MFVLDPNEMLSADEDYLVILATHLVDSYLFLTTLARFSHYSKNRYYAVSKKSRQNTKTLETANSQQKNQKTRKSMQKKIASVSRVSHEIPDSLREEVLWLAQNQICLVRD